MTITTKDVSALIAEGTTSLQKGIARQLAEVVVNREIDRRVDLLDKGYSLRSKFADELEKINKPDTSLTPANGGEKVQFFTPKREQEVASAKKKVGKIEEAMTQALTEGKYEALEKLVKSGGISNDDTSPN